MLRKANFGKVDTKNRKYAQGYFKLKLYISWYTRGPVSSWFILEYSVGL